MRARIVAAVVVFGAAGSAASAHQAHEQSAREAHLAPPVVRESFTPLPCSGEPAHRSTLQEEGCVEQRILRGDAQLNGLARTIFSLLGSDAARRDFIAAQEAWLAYRRADCLSVSNVYEGGTLAPLIDAECSADRNSQRVQQLRTFRSDLLRSG